MGWTTESQGVAVASLASRLSVAIPTIAAFVLYSDALTLSKVSGIIAAILALYLSCIKTSVKQNTTRTLKVLPVVLFVAFGLHSATMKYVQERYLDVESYHLYVMASFTFAFLMAGVFLLWKTLMGKQGFQRRDLVLGCVLGVSNYGAIYYLIRTLGVQGWQSSQLFPTISVAVVGLSTLGARVIFSETLSWRVIGALVVGAGSIVLVNLN
ncbi:MAG: hypothetical protein GY906_27305 [bacterium]|nr:hypothetical protein [bacterium]